MRFKTLETDRRQLARVIAEALGETITYAGFPTYDYLVGDWTIKKSGWVIPGKENLQKVQDVLRAAGAI